MLSYGNGSLSVFVTEIWGVSTVLFRFDYQAVRVRMLGLRKDDTILVVSIVRSARSGIPFWPAVSCKVPQNTVLVTTLVLDWLSLNFKP